MKFKLKYKNKNLIECKVCGTPLELEKEKLIIVSEPSFIRPSETHDAFDCQVCGCQNVVGVRLPKIKGSKND